MNIYRQIKKHRHFKSMAIFKLWCTYRQLTYLHKKKKTYMGQIDYECVKYIYALILTHHARALSFYAAII